MERHSVHDAISAVKDAQKWVEEAQSNANGYTEAQNHLNFAEELLSNAQVEYGNIQDKRELQHASDLLRLLQETQQSNRTQ
ncbi:hypothetical protein GH741_13770 [Aquibacillus halophilus]|uniref:DUF2564 family protein n=1 Tax=Aquibacillus halophilus TaxID=930132 RepID=A0A6A8DJ12_9BACI|nr:hypothetical protein [Aquibacillus halophilus]MRH43741.1 hypothetical protein [Aquibacillus halophilus]